MSSENPIVTAENAYFLKGHASWLYCAGCKKTVAYLCYVTYRYFRFTFSCSCGCHGWVENKFGEIEPKALSWGTLRRNPVNRRYCCQRDGSALFSPVPKNLKSYQAIVVCRKCNTKYTITE